MEKAGAAVVVAEGLTKAGVAVLEVAGGLTKAGTAVAVAGGLTKAGAAVLEVA